MTRVVDYISTYKDGVFVRFKRIKKKVNVGYLYLDEGLSFYTAKVTPWFDTLSSFFRVKKRDSSLYGSIILQESNHKTLGDLKQMIVSTGKHTHTIHTRESSYVACNRPRFLNINKGVTYVNNLQSI